MLIYVQVHSVFYHLFTHAHNKIHPGYGVSYQSFHTKFCHFINEPLSKLTNPHDLYAITRLWRKGRYCPHCSRCHTAPRLDLEANLVHCSACDKYLHLGIDTKFHIILLLTFHCMSSHLHVSSNISILSRQLQVW